MNFMPSEEAFFDEPLVDNPAASIDPRGPCLDSSYMERLLASSVNQEKLLGRLVGEIEQINLRLHSLEAKILSERPTEKMHSSIPAISARPTSPPLPKEPRGTLVLPPGSRPANGVLAPTVAPSVQTSQEEENQMLARRRAEEEARLLRIEAERKAKEAQDEQRRLEEAKRIEEERRAKAELERKTRGLMTDLLITNVGGSLFEDDDLLAGSTAKPKGGGLFDD